MRQIFTTYSTVTEESSADGDHAESGWYDNGFRFDAADKPNEGETCDPDKWDADEGLTAVDLAVRYLRKKGVIESSSSQFHLECWYCTEYQTEDCASGEQIQYCFHLEGFSEGEQREIFRQMTAPRHNLVNRHE